MLRQASHFFVGNDSILRTLQGIAAQLDKNGERYAITGSMAMLAYGCYYATCEIEIIFGANATTEIDGMKFIPLHELLEDKLAIGITKPSRIKELADVQEMIRVKKLPRDFAQQLNPYVRAKYLELWDAVAAAPPEE